MTLRLLHVSNSLCQFDIVDKGAMTKNGPLMLYMYLSTFFLCYVSLICVYMFIIIKYMYTPLIPASYKYMYIDKLIYYL